MAATLWILVSLATATDEPLAPWASNRYPTDVPKRHLQKITEGRAEYIVVQGGTMDGWNCRSPQGVWQPFQQTWESNRSVRMENRGETDVVNPWLSNGRNDFRSLDEIVARAAEPGMTDKEKAMALWWQEVQHRFHLEGDNNELLDPVKVFNVYGHNTCGNDSICLAGQWRRAGLRVAPARLVGHCISQVFFDGRWNLMDGDMHSAYLLRDNETVASEQDLVRDHDLIRRTHTQGILQPDGRAGDEWESSIYVFEGEVTGDRNSPGDTAMHMTLRPGEALVWRWGHVNPVKYRGGREPRFPARICNGLWEYRPDFTKPAWRKGAATVEGIKQQEDGLAAEQGKTGVAIWAMRSPYVFVGGKLEIEGSGARFAISWDGRSWHEVESPSVPPHAHEGKEFDPRRPAPLAKGGKRGVTDLDGFFGHQGPARYAYYLRCQLSGDARLRRLAIINDLQMAPLTLPGMGVGKNAFTYTDQSAGGRQVRITHQWVERSASRPPAAPPEPVFPPRGGEAEGTNIVFEWKPPADPDGDSIADYHFELSARPDMKWPLSMSFAKLISRTADAQPPPLSPPSQGRERGVPACKPRYTLPEPGLLNPDRQYFWRVRAQDDKDVWGPWSETWSFTPRGTAPPLDVTLQFDGARHLGVLRWMPNPMGRRPVAYRIYASDEKGFSVSDKPYSVTVGVSKELPSIFPANFVTETGATELAVVGTDVAIPGANKVFYRVVAVDASGKRSGPSDYAASPRPVIFSKPVTKARKGVEYRYQVSAVRSLGDLRMRIEGGKETLSFWDIERPRFAIERGPRWLAIDEATGLLSGAPDGVGKSEVVIAVTLQRDFRRLDEEALKWGIEKVVSSGTETVGSSTQSFIIEVGP
ncbi:MAG: hypothetical protein HY000_41360 [Planctomycetes bacterium]|nr:hypothetical protein [Planctomycetota bacterium]